MMARKLAGFLAIMGLVVLFGTWLVRTWQGRSTLTVDQAVSYGFCILIAYFVAGIFVAKVGISLIQEVIEERRSREEEQRYRARLRYEQAVAEEMKAAAEEEGGEAPPAEGETPPGTA